MLGNVGSLGSWFLFYVVYWSLWIHGSDIFLDLSQDLQVLRSTLTFSLFWYILFLWKLCFWQKLLIFQKRVPVNVKIDICRDTFYENQKFLAKTKFTKKVSNKNRLGNIVGMSIKYIKRAMINRGYQPKIVAQKNA